MDGFNDYEVKKVVRVKFEGYVRRFDALKDMTENGMTSTPGYAQRRVRSDWRAFIHDKAYSISEELYEEDHETRAALFNGQESLEERGKKLLMTYIDEMGDDVLLITTMDVEHMLITQRGPITVHCTLKPMRSAEKSKPKPKPVKKRSEEKQVSSDKSESTEDRAIFKELMKNASVKQLGEAFFKKMGRSIRHGNSKVHDVTEMLKDMMADSKAKTKTSATKFNFKTPKSSPSHTPTSGENIRFLVPGSAARGPTVVHIYTPSAAEAAVATAAAPAPAPAPAPAQSLVQQNSSACDAEQADVLPTQVDAIVKSAIKGALEKMRDADEKTSCFVVDKSVEVIQDKSGETSSMYVGLGTSDGAPIAAPTSPMQERMMSEDQSVDAVVSQEDKSTATDIKAAVSTATSTIVATTRETASGGDDDDEEEYDLID